jgi:hypothetical protein
LRHGQRFEAALKSALNTPHKPLKEKPKVKKAAKKTKTEEEARQVSRGFDFKGNRNAIPGYYGRTA